MEKLQTVKIPLEEIIVATNNFHKDNFIAKGGFGDVYKGKLSTSDGHIMVAVKRLDRKFGQGNHEFLTEISMLSCYKHENLVSLVGFSDECGEKILVFVHESRGSLDKFIHDMDLTWMQRLQISIDVARGLNYLHDGVGQHHRVLHRDIKSANILLNDDWKAKVSDFGLAIIGPSNIEHTFLVTNPCGTRGYVDPVYYETEILTKESDIYSFGVVLFEILCGRLAFLESALEDKPRFLGPLAKSLYEQNRVDEIINTDLRKQIHEKSLHTFSAIAYQCLNSNRSQRPTIGEVLVQLEKALEHQVPPKPAEIAWNGNARHGISCVGMWGTKSPGGPKNQWYLDLDSDEHLKKISIDHGDVIYSLKFTIECRGIEQTWEKAGGWNGGDIISEVIFALDEEIICLSGTVGVSSGTYAGRTVISSLSFITNKKTHGPYGRVTGTPFVVPCDIGTFAGFYGIASYHLDGIGIYLKDTV